jgi:flagellum-specific ATP synthase
MSQHRALALIREAHCDVRTGRIRRVMPTWLEGDGPNVPVGTLCSIARPAAAAALLAEVVRIDATGVALVPYGDPGGVVLDARIAALDGEARVPVGDAFVGRAVDALGQALDGGQTPVPDAWSPLHPDPPPALARETPDTIFESGIRVIDGLLTIGRGQRIGIFAASGVGKTSLLTQLIRQAEADVCVTCLVGERGREVESLWTNELSGEARKRSAVVVSTSDQAAALRVRAVYQAIALARHWRSQGLNVLFVLDSVTRFAMALRELGLAAGEPPTVRAYTPGVFAALPRMVEQFGAVKGEGSITAVMTVLSETDDVEDPLSELMKSLLDGHLLLSRKLAESGHYPAIDPLKSVSRTRPSLRTAAHLSSARQAQRALARFEAARPLIEAGLYTEGSEPEIDAARATRPALNAFLQQAHDTASPFGETLAMLSRAIAA